MAFEEFIPPRRRTHFSFPVICFYNIKPNRKRLYMSYLNKLAEDQLFKKGDKVNIFYDQKRNVIGLQLDKHGAYRVSGFGIRGVGFSLCAFVNYFKINSEHFRNKHYRLEKEGEFIIFDLNKPLTKVKEGG